MLDRPELAGAEKSHLDFVDHQQDAVAVEDLLELDEEVHRRNDVAAGALDGLDVERGVFGLARFRIPDAVIFALEQPLELPARSGEPYSSLLMPLAAAEVIRKRQEVRAVAEMADSGGDSDRTT